jgi:hypothetical protein
VRFDLVQDRWCRLCRVRSGYAWHMAKMARTGVDAPWIRGYYSTLWQLVLVPASRASDCVRQEEKWFGQRAAQPQLAY